MDNPTQQEIIEAYQREFPGCRLRRFELDFLSAIRAARGRLVGFGWMRQAIGIVWKMVDPFGYIDDARLLALYTDELRLASASLKQLEEKLLEEKLLEETLSVLKAWCEEWRQEGREDELQLESSRLFGAAMPLFESRKEDAMLGKAKGNVCRKGEFVQYVDDRVQVNSEGAVIEQAEPREPLLAVIVRVVDAEQHLVDLHVFRKNPSGWERRVAYDQVTKRPGTWHW